MDGGMSAGAPGAFVYIWDARLNNLIVFRGGSGLPVQCVKLKGTEMTLNEVLKTNNTEWRGIKLASSLLL
jgi:hypothetical protein